MKTDKNVDWMKYDSGYEIHSFVIKQKSCPPFAYLSNKLADFL